MALGFWLPLPGSLLHMEIVNERLLPRVGLDLIQTAPNVTYDVTAETAASIM